MKAEKHIEENSFISGNRILSICAKVVLKDHALEALQIQESENRKLIEELKYDLKKSNLKVSRIQGKLKKAFMAGINFHGYNTHGLGKEFPDWEEWSKENNIK